jgi:hypothetical protein
LERADRRSSSSIKLSELSCNKLFQLALSPSLPILSFAPFFASMKQLFFCKEKNPYLSVFLFVSDLGFICLFVLACRKNAFCCSLLNQFKRETAGGVKVQKNRKKSFQKLVMKKVKKMFITFFLKNVESIFIRGKAKKGAKGSSNLKN